MQYTFCGAHSKKINEMTSPFILKKCGSKYKEWKDHAGKDIFRNFTTTLFLSVHYIGIPG